MRSVRLMTLWMVTASCLGCHRASDEAPVAMEGVQEAVVKALDAWKQGNTEGLKQQSPAIRFVDDDLVEGSQLVAYALEPVTGTQRGVSRISVRLTLRDSQGKTTERSVRYQVTLSPQVSVLRDDS